LIESLTSLEGGEEVAETIF